MASAAREEADVARGTTLQPVAVAPRRWEDYRGIAPDGILEDAAHRARALRAARILHVNATAYGGGVAELLASEIALLRDLGIDAEWRVICPDAAFFEVTKQIHNAMQGKAAGLSESDRAVYVERNEHCAAMLADEWDLVVIHDPQPAALRAYDPVPGARWIWRCHIDTSTPDPDAWAFLGSYVSAYDAYVFTLAAFAPAEFEPDRLAVIAPAIDPLSTKNRSLPHFLARSTVAASGIDLARPLVVQVSRFDPWKDPLGVVEAWRMARERVPGLQLALVGSMADDDPEGWKIYELARKATASEPDCHLLTNQTGIGALEVNAFQREADVVVQKSLREGFGLTVAEALWKETPVVGGNAGGIPLQIGDDEAGVLVDSVEDCAAAVVALLEDAELAERKGRIGRDRVRRDFLIPRLARDDIALYAKVLGSAKGASASPDDHSSPEVRQ